MTRGAVALTIDGLPDNYQSAFIFRNGIRYSIALTTNTRVDTMSVTVNRQSGLSDPVRVSGVP